VILNDEALAIHGKKLSGKRIANLEFERVPRSGIYYCPLNAYTLIFLSIPLSANLLISGCNGPLSANH